MDKNRTIHWRTMLQEADRQRAQEARADRRAMLVGTWLRGALIIVACLVGAWTMTAWLLRALFG